MRKLIEFILLKKHWFLFVLLEMISLVLIYRNSAYQRTVFLSSANVVAGKVASLSASVLSYMDLREKNRFLLEQNGHLQKQVLDLQDRIEEILADSMTFNAFAADSGSVFSYHMIPAQVINNSVTSLYNYITLNKGRKDGIEPDMGVVSSEGVVGVVSLVSDNMSVVIPLLNPKLKLSCRVQGNTYFGTLSWDGKDETISTLTELPRHVNFNKGDTIVTSGYSAIFPSGMIVGRVLSYEKERDDGFYSLQVQLATNFASLNDVLVINNYRQKEKKELEKEAKKND